MNGFITKLRISQYQHWATILVIASAMFLSVPAQARAMSLFEGFPSFAYIIPFFETKKVNSLPVYEVEERERSEQEILLSVCEKRGYGEECGKALLGMMWKESLNHAQAIGDNGEARGYFQIWTNLHKVTVECAEDLECSAEWTLDYLEYNKYPQYPTYAVQCHNGCNAGNGYAASALRHGRRLWNQPVPDYPYWIAKK